MLWASRVEQKEDIDKEVAETVIPTPDRVDEEKPAAAIDCSEANNPPELTTAPRDDCQAAARDEDATPVAVNPAMVKAAGAAAAVVKAVAAPRNPAAAMQHLLAPFASSCPRTVGNVMAKTMRENKCEARMCVRIQKSSVSDASCVWLLCGVVWSVGTAGDWG